MWICGLKKFTSSNNWSIIVSVSGCALSTSSNKTTAFGAFARASVKIPVLKYNSFMSTIWENFINKSYLIPPSEYPT